jgi:tRNA modification GTPase
MKILVTDKDTICALATAHGIGAISVIRISGEKAAEIIRKIAAFLPQKLESHKIYYGFLNHVGAETRIDEVLVSYFQEGRSFSGEATFEISCHGSEVIVDEIIRQLILAGARAAKRGEFTYRAFMNGRLDLVQAESVLDLIQSRSPRASQLALRQLQGDFSKRIQKVLDSVIWVLANLEANIDFASEDIEIAGVDTLVRRTKLALEETHSLMAGYNHGRMIRSGFQVALVGRPNVGKSSLLNALTGEDLAIVTPVPGTTRDFVEGEFFLEGVRVTLVDTAGLRATEDMVESIGVERSFKKLQEVDLVLYVLDATEGVTDADRDFFTNLPWSKTVIAINKVDIGEVLRVDSVDALACMALSARTGAGLVELKSWISSRLRLSLGEDSTLMSNSRHFEGLALVATGLKLAAKLLEDGSSPDLIALELQSSLRALHEILGIAFDDQVMDRVFAEFCLGK